MYICLCENITDKDIHQAVNGGARSIRELRQQLNVCGGCGKCGLAARECLNKAMVDKTRNSPSAINLSGLRSALYSPSKLAASAA